MKKFTINDIRGWKPCYDPTYYLPESWQGTALDILNKKRIPFKDRFWVIMRTDLVSEKLMRKFAVWCARQVQHLMVDERSIHALDVMEAYAENRWLIDDPEYVMAWEDELAAARIEAWKAVKVAAGIGAWTAAEAVEAAARVAWYAAGGATRNSARYADAVAACAALAAAWASTRYAAEAAQERKLRKMLIEGIKTGDTK